MSEREAFLKALAKNEDDTALRLVFADWLDEHGEHEEADRQRKWPAAKEWFIRFCRENNPQPGEYTDAHPISYERLLEMGHDEIRGILSSCQYDITHDSLMQMLASGGWEMLEKAHLIEPAERWEFHISLGNNLDMCDALRQSAPEFWTNWSIMTGIPLPPGVEEKTRFSCGC